VECLQSETERPGNTSTDKYVRVKQGRRAPEIFLSAAFRLFAEKNYDCVTLQDTAANVGGAQLCSRNVMSDNRRFVEISSFTEKRTVVSRIIKRRTAQTLFKPVEIKRHSSLRLS
jgi:hypothetical protein